MSLKDLDLLTAYKSRDKIVENFYIPCFLNSSFYIRHSGYFSSAILKHVSRGLSYFLSKNGKMQLLCSPDLSDEDVKALNDGASVIKIIDKVTHISASKLEEDLSLKSREVLSWMVTNGLLECRLAIPMENGQWTGGIYHEKVGIFQDGDNIISFKGSNNETERAIKRNFESFEVFKSWTHDEKRVNNHLEDAQRNWALADQENVKENDDLRVFKWDDKIEEILSKYKPSSQPSPDGDEESTGESNKKNHPTPRFPQWLIEEYPENDIDIEKTSLHPFQKDVIRDLRSKNFKGLVQLATGCGKTLTALSAILDMIRNDIRLKLIIIVCPTNVLIEQWQDEVAAFNFKPIVTKERGWLKKYNRELILGIDENTSYPMIITSYAAYAKDNSSFVKEFDKLPDDSLIIFDECHNITTRVLKKIKSQDAKYRIGLSATPDRNEENTDTEIRNYFRYNIKPIIGIREAITHNILANYKYHPVFLHLEEDEWEQIRDLQRQYAIAKRNGDFDKETIIACAIARVKAVAVNKVPNVIKKLKSLSDPGQDWLFYCGAGSNYENAISSEGADDELVLSRQINYLAKELKRIDFMVMNYTYETEDEDRKWALQCLEEQKIDGLLAINCLDEGVNVPTVKNAFILASSTNYRQFVQRRGRVLRKPKTDPYKTAHIYDLIVLPPEEESLSKFTHKFMKNDLKRVEEFCDTALNTMEASQKVRSEVVDRYWSYKFEDSDE